MAKLDLQTVCQRAFIKVGLRGGNVNQMSAIYNGV